VLVAADRLVESYLAGAHVDIGWREREGFANAATRSFREEFNQELVMVWYRIENQLVLITG